MSERLSGKATSAEFYQEVGSAQKYLAILETVAETEDTTTGDGSLEVSLVQLSSDETSVLLIGPEGGLVLVDLDP